jgi:uncharacterized protein YbjT (DUF2867 family)
LVTAATDVVTGAFSYTGAAIARHLLGQGRRVRTLTGHPDRPVPFSGDVEVHPYAFGDPDALRRTLEGADTLYNTFWVRFDRGAVSFEGAIERSRILFEASRDAGVRRVVHVSVTNPDPESRFPYFRGKAQVEQILASVAASWAVVRPTIIFGPGDILMNNIAWCMRRFPVFAVPGDGTYRVRPVHADDVASLCFEVAGNAENLTVDAVGPDSMTFEEMCLTLRDGVGSSTRFVHVPPKAARAAAAAIGAMVGDVLVTDHELGGLMAEQAWTDGPTTGNRRFSDWVGEEGPRLGRRYESEIKRHFRR